ncbi:putative transcription factor Trihelix family [Dioscorea sansibarensis]
MEGGGGIPSGGSNIAPCAMLGLEMPLHHHNQQQQQLLSFSNHSREAEKRHPPQAIRAGGYGTNFNVSGSASGSGRGKQQQQPSLSSEEEALPAGPEGAGGDGTKRVGVGQTQTASPWQRMKWTDSMIRLLIMVVYCVGDDIGADGGGDTQHTAVGKGKKAASSAGQLQQKKGKWKSVSRAMMERGYCVSPQQCEDKFNDLNKRYKRVNDLLGKGTACRVVENQSLLDSMDNLSPKAKEEARKLLNSKHLFFREMCAYHTSCTAAAAAAASAAPLPSATAVPDHFHDQQAPHVLAAPAAAGVGDTGQRMMEMERERHDDEDDADNEVEGEDDYNDEYLDDEDDEDEGDHRARHNHSHHHYKHEERERGRVRDREADEDTKGATTSMGGLVAGTKRPRRLSLGLPSASSASSPLSLSLSSPSSASTSMQQLRSELMGLANGGVSEQHQKHWLKNRALELEEQQVHLQSRALELERQRFKWLRFSSNKERELEKAKIENERLRLENERMLLLLRQKEFQLINASDTVTFLASTSDAQHQQQQQLLPCNYKRSADHHPYPL